MDIHLGSEDLNAVQILFTGELRASDSFSLEDYRNMASYLKRIHDCTYPFYDGVSPFHADITQRTLMPCMTPIASTSSSQQEWQYSASATDAAALKGVRDILVRKLSLLCKNVPHKAIQGDLSCFHQYGLQVIDMPEIIKIGSSFTELYPHPDAFKSAISEAQLWLHFFDFFCDIMGSMMALTDIGAIDIASIRGSKVLRAAHEYYITGGDF